MQVLIKDQHGTAENPIKLDYSLDTVTQFHVKDCSYLEIKLPRIVCGVTSSLHGAKGLILEGIKHSKFFGGVVLGKPNAENYRLWSKSDWDTSSLRGVAAKGLYDVTLDGLHLIGCQYGIQIIGDYIKAYNTTIEGCVGDFLRPAGTHLLFDGLHLFNGGVSGSNHLDFIQFDTTARANTSNVEISNFIFEKNQSDTRQHWLFKDDLTQQGKGNGQGIFFDPKGKSDVFTDFVISKGILHVAGIKAMGFSGCTNFLVDDVRLTNSITTTYPRVVLDAHNKNFTLNKVVADEIRVNECEGFTKTNCMTIAEYNASVGVQPEEPSVEVPQTEEPVEEVPEVEEPSEPEQTDPALDSCLLELSNTKSKLSIAEAKLDAILKILTQ